jgi:MYND finger
MYIFIILKSKIMNYHLIVTGALSSILSVCKSSLKKLKKHQIQSMIIRTKSNNKLKLKSIKNLTESEGIKVLDPPPSSSIQKEKIIDIDNNELRNKGEKEKEEETVENKNKNKKEEGREKNENEVDEENTETGEELNFENLYLDSIGIYTVLEFSLLGSIRCLFRGPKKSLKDDGEKNKGGKYCRSNDNNNDKISNNDKKILSYKDDNKTTTSLPSPPLPLPLPLSLPLNNNCLYCNVAVINNTRCSRCKLPYCNKEHQRLHWNVHKVRTYLRYSIFQ